MFGPTAEQDSKPSGKTTATPGRGGDTSLTIALTAVKFMLRFSVRVSMGLSKGVLNFQGATLSVTKAQ